MTNLNTIASQKYRRKLKDPENIELLQAYREQNRKYQEKHQAKLLLDDKLVDNYRKRKAEAQKAYRDRKKIIIELNDEGQYNSQSALKKAAAKIVKTLPTSKIKAQEAIKLIADKLDLKLVDKTLQQMPSKTKSFSKSCQTITAFYEFPQISRQLPGKKDYATIRNVKEGKQRVQKRLMLMTVDEAYHEFIKMYPDLKVSSSKFHYLRPKHIDIVAKTPHNMCCCSYCENMQFVFDSISKYLSTDISSLSILLEKLVCSSDDYNCVAGNCGNCKNFSKNFFQLLQPGCENDQVKLKQWQKVGNFTQKVDLRDIKLKHSSKMFVDTFAYFKIHKYLIRTHFEFIDNLKKTQADDH